MMQENSEESLIADQEGVMDVEEILPSSAELTPLERKRANSLMRTALLMMEDSRFPPRPTYRSGIEIGARTMNGLILNLTVSSGIEFPPVPVSPGWISRLVLARD